LVPAEAQQIMGRAFTIDGDTIEIHGQRIRLFGIDAPEGGQLCRKDGKPWRCAQASAFALDALLREKVTSCTPVDIDRYKRIVPRCFAAGVEVNETLPRQYTSRANGPCTR
jgi:endonuclease YncB( thermonuclease family)